MTAQEQDIADQVIHVVQPGENLYRIALRYGLTVDELVLVNEITDPSRIRRGQEILIPGLSAPTGDEVYNPLIAGTPVTHVVQPGDSVTIIANQYGLTVEQLLQANNISNPNLIYRGQELTVWTTESVNAPADELVESEPATLEVATTDNMTTYVVRRGDHLSDIAQRFGIGWQTLAQINGIANPNQLYAGQTIIVPAVTVNGVPNNDLGLLVQQGPGATITTGKQIVVDLSDSITYAYEDGTLVYSTVVSTGLPATPTVTGDFAIYAQIRSQTMSGPGYSLPNVEWVQYFYQGYALHGTYWHNNFGRPMSHGCVNMTNADAEWFYTFASIGTPVHVQY